MKTSITIIGHIHFHLPNQAISVPVPFLHRLRYPVHDVKRRVSRESAQEAVDEYRRFPDKQ